MVQIVQIQTEETKCNKSESNKCYLSSDLSLFYFVSVRSNLIKGSPIYLTNVFTCACEPQYSNSTPRLSVEYWSRYQYQPIEYN